MRIEDFLKVTGKDKVERLTKEDMDKLFLASGIDFNNEEDRHDYDTLLPMYNYLEEKYPYNVEPFMEEFLEDNEDSSQIWDVFAEKTGDLTEKIYTVVDNHLIMYETEIDGQSPFGYSVGYRQGSLHIKDIGSIEKRTSDLNVYLEENKLTGLIKKLNGKEDNYLEVVNILARINGIGCYDYGVRD